jgi:hypothetical protein
MPSIDELLHDHARRWREHVDAHGESRQTSSPTSTSAARPTSRRRRVWIAVGVAVAVAVAGLTIGAIVVRHGHDAQHPLAAATTPLPRPPRSQPASTATRTTQSGLHLAPNPAPSPPPEAWGYCGNIRSEADARSLVGGGEATALVEAHAAGAAILSYRVLAGRATGLQTLNNLTVPPGRYLLLLGGAAPTDYYAALGYYGVYRIAGAHAYQLCAYGVTEVKRGGVTDTDRITELLRNALRR